MQAQSSDWQMNRYGCFFSGQQLGKQELISCNYLTITNEAAIPTNENNTPIRTYTPRLTPHQLTWLKKELKRMEETEVIQPSKSHLVSPIALVPKGDKYRLCINYKELNKRIHIPHTILPNHSILIVTNCVAYDVYVVSSISPIRQVNH